ncbi:hypothetical protein B0T10DRAFT_454604 [Thelonectria olida]|uniref:Uncharacterized protein n=1 Tax=Thelonectria olida TaxID=1576542 RepID=A0A9P8WD14_9HYPO|nr:hypothetical protein B0T10DRAFT_454604 [Thelonectria olida]
MANGFFGYQPLTELPGCTSHPPPPAARSRYEKQFYAECGGKPYLTGIEAAAVFFSSGLSKSDLSRIWDDTDRNKDGHFDKEEFIQAMWLIELHTGRVGQSGGSTNSVPSTALPPAELQAGDVSHSIAVSQTSQYRYAPVPPPPPYSQLQGHVPPLYHTPVSLNNPASEYAIQHIQSIQNPQQPQQSQASPIPNRTGPESIEISVALTCQGCGNGLCPNDSVYRPLLNSTAFSYFCTNCHKSNKCPPAATLVNLVAGQQITSRKKKSTTCDGCWRDIKKDEMTWFCKKKLCDKDLCRKCWGKKKRHCKHAAQGHVEMMKLGERGERDTWDVDDVLGTIGDFAVSLV